MAKSAVLLLGCHDRPGIVSQVTSHIYENGGNIIRAEQSESVSDGRFFLRVLFDLQGEEFDLSILRTKFQNVAVELEADWSLRDPDDIGRVVLMTSKQSHCLLDLLARVRTGDLRARVVAIVSNHENAADIAEAFRIPYHYLPVSRATKPQQEERLRDLLSRLDADLIVLARYMQILSDSFVHDWDGKIINIHHSFLPAFPGSRPYHQAMERGVKLIGATAHYATAELDEGPIIEQSVTRTSHRDSVEDFVRRGREVESKVLASAVRAHLEHRVIVDGTRTIVFE